MYRVLSTQKCNIYCERDQCNFKCGFFHRPEARKHVKKSLRDRRAKHFRVQSLDISTHIGNGDSKHEMQSANSDGPLKISYLNVQEPNAIEPITPLTVSGASTVTLEEIIASAKRKISQDYVDLRIPSPIFFDESDSELHHLAKQRNLIGGTPWPKDIYNLDESDHREDLSFVEHLVNSESEDDELWVERDPPSIIEDGEQEDFDELLKVTQPPNDHYSNPLYRKADKLIKKRARRKASDLYDDNSSVDLSVADMSESHLDWDLNFALLQSRLSDTDNKFQYEGNL